MPKYSRKRRYKKKKRLTKVRQGGGEKIYIGGIGTELSGFITFNIKDKEGKEGKEEEIFTFEKKKDDNTYTIYHKKTATEKNGNDVGILYPTHSSISLTKGNHIGDYIITNIDKTLSYKTIIYLKLRGKKIILSEKEELTIIKKHNELISTLNAEDLEAYIFGRNRSGSQYSQLIEDFISLSNSD